MANFPILVELVAGNFDWTKCNSDGLDIRFTSSDGTTLLKYEREQWNLTSSLATFHVKVPVVSLSADTVIYIYYRTVDSADGDDAVNVWDSDYVAVYHLDETGVDAQLLDSTSNLNHSTVNRAVSVAGKIFNGMHYYSGHNDYSIVFTLANDYEGTFECFIKPTGISAIYPPFSDNGNGYVELSFNKSGDLNNHMQFGANDGTAMRWATGSSTLSAATWYWVGGKFESGVKTKVWLTGAADGESSALFSGLIPDLSEECAIGRNSTPTYFLGIIDEFRYSKVARADAWMKASFWSETNGLVAYGNLETSTASFNEIIILDSEIVFEVTLESEISIQRT